MRRAARAAIRRPLVSCSATLGRRRAGAPVDQTKPPKDDDDRNEKCWCCRIQDYLDDPLLDRGAVCLPRRERNGGIARTPQRSEDVRHQRGKTGIDVPPEGDL